MTYYRGIKFNISFVCKTADGRVVFTETGRMVAIAPYDFVYKKYDTKEEADALGDINVWAKEGTDKWAEEEAKAYCGEGTISADEWGSKILDTDEADSIDKLFKPKCPEADVVLYKTVLERLAKYKREMKVLETRRDVLTKIKERSDTEIDELRVVRNRLERLYRSEKGDIEQKNRLEAKCPNIANM